MGKKAFLLGSNTHKIKYAESDVQLMSECLQQYNYQVKIPQRPFTKADIDKQFDTWLDEEIEATDTIIFYYSGHGLAPKGDLYLLLNNDINKRQNKFPLKHITDAFNECGAREKIIILDCCRALTVQNNWQPEESNYYRILTASGSLPSENSKEFDELKAGFLTYYFCQGLSKYYNDITNDNNEILISLVYDWLYKKTNAYNLSTSSIKVQEPYLLGNAGADIVIAKLEGEKICQKNISSSKNNSASHVPFQAPPLPIHFVDRPEVSQKLKKRLIADSTNHSGTLVISAIQGLGGIGKTILAQALAHDPQVQERFCDGILWATLGQQPDVLSLLQGWIIALKDYDYKPTTVQAASNHLNSLLYDKAVLLVIDDGWNIEDIEPFRVGSGKCQVIITTRRADVEEELDAQLYSLDLMNEEHSLMLLANRLGRDLEDTEKEEAKKLAEAVEYLPFALDLAAVRVTRGKSWLELYSALTEEIARLDVLDGVRRRSKKETRLEALFNLSINFLIQDFPEAWSNFIWLGVLPEDVTIAAPMVATLWQKDIDEAEEILELFWNDALLLPGIPVKIGQKEWETYRIHDLLHDLAINWLTKDKSPGLGLTIPQAHGVLLKRYQNHLDDRKWHKLADDGYIHDHLTWHMEKAGRIDSIHQLLQEDTDSGKNGWHSKCESLGKTAIFVGDVARAWRLAESEYETNPTIALGLQCRYSLITSSLNTIAGNIPPKLISVLVEKKVWTPAQGLAYSRQVTSLPQRVKALSQLASYFPEIWSEALAAARNIESESERARVLSSLAPHLTENLLSEALAEALAPAIKYESERAKVLSLLAPHLPENLLSEALAAARNIESESKRAEVLSSLAPHLPENLLSEALAATRNIKYESKRAKVLSSLAPHLPENLLSEALAATRNIRNKSKRAKVLSSLAPHLPENLLSEALAAARNIKYESKRAEVLSLLAPHLPENLLSEALEVVRKIADEKDRTRVLRELISNEHKMLDFFPFWCEIIHSLASLNRRALLGKIGENSHIIKELGDSETFREIGVAINDVGKWFP